ncbi:hypothetical protein RhiirA4_429047, partial [Rhizophagus irregularis]
EDELFLAGFSSSADDEDVIKAIKKRMKKKQDTRSDVEYEELEDGLREVKKERKPWAGKPGSRMGRKKKKEPKSQKPKRPFRERLQRTKTKKKRGRRMTLVKEARKKYKKNKNYLSVRQGKRKGS